MNTTDHWTWMVWREDDPKDSPAQTLAKAIEYYTNKYKCPPTHARLPLAWPDLNGDTPAGLQIERARNVLPRHIHLAADPEALKAALAALEAAEMATLAAPSADLFNLRLQSPEDTCQNS